MVAFWKDPLPLDDDEVNAAAASRTVRLVDAVATAKTTVAASATSRSARRRPSVFVTAAALRDCSGPAIVPYPSSGMVWGCDR